MRRTVSKSFGTVYLETSMAARILNSWLCLCNDCFLLVMHVLGFVTIASIMYGIKEWVATVHVIIHAVCIL